MKETGLKMKTPKKGLRLPLRQLLLGAIFLSSLWVCMASCNPETETDEVEASVEAAIAKTREIELIRTQAARDFSSTLTAKAPTVEAASPISTRIETATATAEIEASRALNKVVVVVSSVSLRNGPGIWYKVLGYLYRNDFAEVFAKSNIDGDWYNVRLDDGTIGWISKIGVEPANAFNIELVPTVATLPPVPPTETTVPTNTPAATSTPEPLPPPRATSTPTEEPVTSPSSTPNPYPYPGPNPATPTAIPTENFYP